MGFALTGAHTMARLGTDRRVAPAYDSITASGSFIIVHPKTTPA